MNLKYAENWRHHWLADKKNCSASCSYTLNLHEGFPDTDGAKPTARRSAARDIEGSVDDVDTKQRDCHCTDDDDQ